jgi:hypothetical protein
MTRKMLTLGGGLIALYLGVYYATGAGNLIKTGASGGATIIRAFQGR